MPQASVTFECNGSPEEILALLKDLEFLGKSIPELVSVDRLSDTEAVWTVRPRVGPIHRTMAFRGTLREATTSGVRFRAEAKEAAIDGSVLFRPDGAGGRTTVVFSLTITGRGTFGSLIDSMARSHLNRDLQGFARRLEERFPTRAGSGAG